MYLTLEAGANVRVSTLKGPAGPFISEIVIMPPL
jgi:hypothetical protein